MAARQSLGSFTANGGRIMGIIGMAIGLIVVIDVFVEWRTAEGLFVAAIALLFCAAFWVGLVRPAVVAYENGVLLRNFLRDVHIPWHLVEHIDLSPILTVYVDGGERHRSVALASTRRDRRTALRSGGHETRPSGDAGAAGVSQGAFAVTRLRALSDEHSKQTKSDGPSAVTKHWAMPELLAIAAVVVFAVTVRAVT